MINIKKTAAFMMSLLLCVSSAAALTVSAEVDLKHGSDEDIFVDSDINVVDTEDGASDLKKSGDFSYSVTTENTVRIESCTSKEKDLVIPDNIDGMAVAELGKTAFGNDSDNSVYETITIPDSVNLIAASNPFYYCPKLKEIILSGDNENYSVSDGILYSKDMSSLICYPSARSGDSFTIDNKVKSIGDCAFYASKLKTVTFPTGLSSIGHHGFGNCESLKAVDMSKTSIKELDDFVFIGCTSLSDVKLPECITNIGGGAFASCSSLAEIEFPIGLLEIGQSAFANTALKHAVIPDSVQNIEYCAFGYSIADDGTETADPNFAIVGSNGSAAFIYATDSDEDYGYRNNFTFLLPEEFEKQQAILSLEKFTDGDFEYTVENGTAAITNCLSTEETVDVPEKLGGYTVTSTYMSAFSNCYARKINLPETVTLIREGSFFGCTYLTEITLPQSVKDIESNAFGNCKVLEKIDLGGAENLGNNVFDNCPVLKSVTISGNCKTIEGDEPFLTCNSLEKFIVGSGDGEFASKDGVLYTKDMKVLVAYPASKKDKLFKIPDSVETIAQSAFAYANFLETVDLSSVKTIEEYAFEGCVVLNRVKMSKELAILGADAFYDCNQLKSLRFYDKIEKIANYSFGFHYNENAESDEDTDIIVEGFKVYAEKDSDPYLYAKEFGLETVSGTVELFDHNVSVAFLIVCGALVLVLILSLIISVIVKKHKKNKNAKNNKSKNNEEKK